MVWRALLLTCLTLGPSLCQTPAEIYAHAREVNSQQGAKAGLPEFERALAAYRDAKDARGEAITLGNIGSCYKALGDLKKSLEFHERALIMKQRLGDRLEAVKTLSNIGLVNYELADFALAVSRFRQALSITKQIGDRRTEAAVENNLGMALSDQGKYAEAREHLEQALQLGNTDALANIGGVHQLMGRNREAAGFYEQSLALSRSSNSPWDESLALGNLALCQLGLGDINKALELYNQAIALARKTGYRVYEADWHKGKGSALRRAGRYDAAQQEYRQAVAVYEAAGKKQKMVEALGDLGLLYLALGDVTEAEKQFRRALALALAIGDPRSVISNQSALGDIEWRRKRYPQALTLYQGALRRARQAGDREQTASALIQIALTNRDQKRYADSSRQATEAGARLIEAQALYALGEVARLRSEMEPALERYRAGEAITSASGEHELGWRLAFGAAQASEALKRPAEAIDACRRAVTMLESVRSLLREERFQAGYIEDKYQVYVMLVRLLLESGQLAEAFSFAERLRARSYADLVRKGRPRVQAAAENELREKIRQLQKALERENNRSQEERRAQDAESYSRELADAERTYQNLLDDLRASDPEYAAAESLKVPELAEVQTRLGPGTALLEYVVGQDQVLALALTAKQVRAHVIPLSSTNLAGRIELLRGLIARRSGDEWRAPAASLGRALIAPLERQAWLAGIRRLYIVPHQSLHYLPFAVLPRGTRTLGEDLAIAYLPAAAVLVHDFAPANNQKRLLAMAPSRPGLKHVEEEARAVLEFFPTGSRALAGERATESAFKSLSPAFGILHLATHASFNRLNPMLSALDLEPGGADDGKLQVHEVLEMRLHASLVTLSACDTAMASGHFAEVPAGDDFVGLTRAFLYAGSRSVLATLWEVDDRSTPALMRGFYSRLDKSDKAAALTAAQRELRGNAQYQHPYYWAAFILVGKMD